MLLNVMLTGANLSIASESFVTLALVASRRVHASRSLIAYAVFRTFVDVHAFAVYCFVPMVAVIRAQVTSKLNERTKST